MSWSEALFDAFINANILICVGFALWHLIRFGLRRTGLGHAYGAQLSLLNMALVASVLAPVAGLAVGALQRAGWVSGVNLTLSDMVVSHYLNGGFQMDAARLEQLIQSREALAPALLGAVGWVVAAALALGALAGALRVVLSVLCLRRIVARSYGWRRFGRVELRLSDRILVPFSARGWRRYYVVLPSSMLAQQDALRVSVAHELQHIRNGDLEWEIALETLKPLFFLNPVYHAWKRQVEELRELACDARVMARGAVDLQAYCDTLLSVCQQRLRRDRTFTIAMPKVTLVTAERAGCPSLIEQRIDALLEGRKLRRPRLLLMLVAAPLVVITGFCALAIQRPGDWSQDRLMLSTVVNLERLDQITSSTSGFGRAQY